MLVKPRAGVTLEQLDKVLEPYGARQIGRIEQIGVYIVQLPMSSDARAVVAALSKNPQIDFAEVDERVPPSPGGRPAKK